MRADNADVVLAAITRAYRSWYQLDADDMETLADKFEAGYDRLSAREIEALELVVKGNSSRDIAMTLGVCIKTVEAHRKRIYDKMRPDDVGHLVRMWRAGNQ